MEMNTASEVVGLTSTLLNIGTGVIIGAALIFLWSVAWLFRTKFRDLKALLLIAMALIMLPYGVKLAQEKTGVPTQANVVLKVENLQIVHTKPGEVMVYFTTPSKVIAYLEYTDAETGQTQAYFPLYAVVKTDTHAIPISKTGSKGGTVVFVLNGAKVAVDGKPTEVR